MSNPGRVNLRLRIEDGSVFDTVTIRLAGAPAIVSDQTGWRYVRDEDGNEVLLGPVAQILSEEIIVRLQPGDLGPIDLEHQGS